MALESATYIDDLVASNPVGGTDDYATADDHLRLIKSVLQNSFPNISGAMNASDVELNTLDGILASTAELNILDGYTGTTGDLNILSGADVGGLTAAELMYVAGVTSDIQTQINGKAASSHTHAATDINSGVMANAQIQESNVTQHQGALSITESQISDLAHTAAYSHPNHTGDVTSTGDGATVIPSATITGKSSLNFIEMADANALLCSAAGVMRSLSMSNLRSYLDNVFLKSGDTPTSLNIGNADTSLTRAAAGVLKVENHAVFTHEDTALTGGQIHIDTGAPTGGANGDIWLEREI